MLYWLLKYVLLGPWLWLIYRPQVEGRHYVPDRGPAIIASNHLSFCDSIFMPLVVKRKVTFVAKSEYFTGRGLKGWLVRMFLGTGTIRSTAAAVWALGGAGHPAAGAAGGSSPVSTGGRGPRSALPGQDRGGPAGAEAAHR